MKFTIDEGKPPLPILVIKADDQEISIAQLVQIANDMSDHLKAIGIDLYLKKKE